MAGRRQVGSTRAELPGVLDSVARSHCQKHRKVHTGRQKVEIRNDGRTDRQVLEFQNFRKVQDPHFGYFRGLKCKIN